DADSLSADPIEILAGIAQTRVTACSTIEWILHQVGAPSPAITHAERLAGLTCAFRRPVTDDGADLVRIALVSASRAVVGVADEHPDPVRIGYAREADEYFASVAGSRRQITVAIRKASRRRALDMAIVCAARAECASVGRVWRKRIASVG